MEVWKPIPPRFALSRYRVSSKGRIRNKKGRIIDPKPGPSGYVQVDLVDDFGGRCRSPMHVIVAEAFHGPRPPGQVIRHLRGLSNAADNLAYGSPTDNYNDRKDAQTQITDELRAMIMERHRNGIYSQKKIAEDLGISQATVSRTIAGCSRRSRADRLEEMEDVADALRAAIAISGPVVSISQALAAKILDALDAKPPSRPA